MQKFLFHAVCNIISHVFFALFVYPIRLQRLLSSLSPITNKFFFYYTTDILFVANIKISLYVHENRPRYCSPFTSFSIVHFSNLIHAYWINLFRIPLYFGTYKSNKSIGYSQSPSAIRGSTPNNCFAVYQEGLVPLLIQANPHPLLLALRNLRRGLTWFG